MKEDERYLSAAATLGERVRRVLSRVPAQIAAEVTEIRLRTGKPLGLMASATVLFVDENGGVSDRPALNAFLLTKADMQDSFVTLCGWAVHSHQRELCDGYLSVRGGHRAGIAATAVAEEGKVTAVRDITSINLRVAREIYGAADPLVRGCFWDRPCGVLIVGPPASGKTTLLRDTARQLSSGSPGGYLKVCVVDESGEIGAASGGVVQSELGPCCDLLSGYPKAKGLQIAVRYLSPQVIVCDEICTDGEVEAVAAAANSGVAVVTSLHAADYEEFLRKPQARRLLETGAFQKLVLLEGAESPSKIREIREVPAPC